MCTNYCRVKCHFKFDPAIALSNIILPEKLEFHGTVFKSMARVTLACKAADEIRIINFFKSFGVKKINYL
jgi:hypothetical protein